MPQQRRNMIDYMVVCVNDYADRHGLTRADSFDYLLHNKGLDFIEDCYEAEHTLTHLMILTPGASVMKGLQHEVVSWF